MTITILATIVFLIATTVWTVQLREEHTTALAIPGAALYGAVTTFGMSFVALAVWVFVTVFRTIIIY